MLFDTNFLFKEEGNFPNKETGRIVTCNLPGNTITAPIANFFCAGVGMKCYRVEVFWGQLGIFQGQCTFQVAPQTALYDKLNDKKPFLSNLGKPGIDIHSRILYTRIDIICPLNVCLN